METNKIVYVRCMDSAIVVHTVYASGYDATDDSIKGYSVRDFEVDERGGWLNIVNQIKQLLDSSDIIYIDTSRSKSMITRVIVYMAYTTYQNNLRDHSIVLMNETDRFYIDLTRAAITLPDNIIDDDEFLGRISNALDIIKGNLDYESTLLDILNTAMTSKFNFGS